MITNFQDKFPELQFGVFVRFLMLIISGAHNNANQYQVYSMVRHYGPMRS